jgi:6-pyruvoyltetrahydropterin/6-carboxytetrahydropterin synthase
MATATITKRFVFDAAHQLPNHDGKCAHLHGHTYTLEVDAQGPVTEYGSPQEGMVIDFALLSNYWKQCLEPLVDHRFLLPLLHPNVSFEKVEVHDKTFFRVVYGTAGQEMLLPAESVAVLPIDNSTAECLAEFFFSEFQHALDRTEAHISAVRVWETASSHAEVEVYAHFRTLRPSSRG